MKSFDDANDEGMCDDCEYDCSACYLLGICQMEADYEKFI